MKVRVVVGFLAAMIIAFVAAPAFAYTYLHEVLPGERLSQIARRYRISVKRIRRLNRLRNSRLRAGQRLRIVTPVHSTTRRKIRHRVVPGDSLPNVAAHYKMSIDLLRRLNRLREEAVLQPGKKIWVVVEHRPDVRRRRGLFQLKSGPGFEVYQPDRAWGTFLAVTRIHDVMSTYAERFADAPPVNVHDLSRRRGGRLFPHRSHRTGRDVDIGYPQRDRSGRYEAVSPRSIDLERSWFLLKAFIDTGDVTHIFVNYSLQRALYRYARRRGASAKWLEEIFEYPKRGSPGIIRHERGHLTHFHVRFRREVTKPEPVS